MSNEEIMGSVKECVPDPGKSRTRDTNLFRIAKVYWMTKVMVAQAMVQYKAKMWATHQEIWVMEAKFELFCKEQFGI